MKHLLLFVSIAQLILCSCVSDPLDKKYDKAAGLKPVYDEHGEAIIDSMRMSYLINAEIENEIHGIANEPFTYRDLIEQGRQMAIKERAKQIILDNEKKINHSN